MNTVYKVVTTDLKSARVLDHRATIRYSIVDYVKPNIEGSLIFVFKDLECAKDFEFNFRSSGRLEIWEALTTTPLVEIKGLIPCYACFENFKKFWSNALPYRCDAPRGSFGCGDLLLVKKLY